MRKRIAVSMVLLALAAAACSKKEEAPKGPEAQTYTVQVDTKKPGQPFNFFATGYFPKELKVHAGDTIDFSLNWSGEPHTVSFGTLIDQGLAKLDPKSDEEPAELKKIPSMLPEGPGDANPVSTNPCFVATGDPTKETCKAEQPAFSGRDAFYSSGFVAPDTRFSVKLAADLAPGTYSYFCTLHRGGMVGKVTVVAASETADTPAEATKTGDEQIAKLVAGLTPAFDQIKNGGGPGVVFAGGFSETLDFEGEAGVAVFGPKDLAVKRNALVKWNILGPHTITFNPPQDAVELLVKAADGWHLNPKALGPAGAPPTETTKETGNVGDGGTWNGEGFFSSGLLLGFGPPGYLTWQVKFGKAGTYKYQCNVHPDMEGTVTVS